MAANTPKPALYADLSPLERLAHMTALSQRQAMLAGERGTPCPRSEWPGEVFLIAEPRATAGR